MFSGQFYFTTDENFPVGLCSCDKCIRFTILKLDLMHLFFVTENFLQVLLEFLRRSRRPSEFPGGFYGSLESKDQSCTKVRVRFKAARLGFQLPS